MKTRGMTRVALLTPPGRGGIALLEIAGADGVSALPVLGRVFERPLPAVGSLALGVLRDGDGPIDEVLVARTADDRFEIGCHGGPAVARRALAALEAAGASVVAADTSSAAESALRAEARALLPRAATELGAKVLLAALSGQLDAALDALPLDEAALSALVGSARLGIACSRPPRVALVGEPNAGKSTLFNALLGRERAIVSAEPGTTRDALEERCSLGGVPVELLDLAGLRETDDEVERAGVARATERALGADLRLVVVDASRPWTAPAVAGPAILVLNKHDLVAGPADVPAGAVAVSAKTGAGVEALAAAIVRELVGAVDVAPAGARPVLFTERQREHATRALEALRAGSAGQARAHLTDLKRGAPWPDAS